MVHSDDTHGEEKRLLKEKPYFYHLQRLEKGTVEDGTESLDSEAIASHLSVNLAFTEQARKQILCMPGRCSRLCRNSEKKC
jgi:hypothetical protein